jgi:hypothetical protein
VTAAAVPAVVDFWSDSGMIVWNLPGVGFDVDTRDGVRELIRPIVDHVVCD